MPTALERLTRTHDQLRRAAFDTAILEQVRTCNGEWRNLRKTNQAEYVRGRCVVSEALDYFGDYAGAADALKDEQASVLDELCDRPSDQALSSEERALWKRKIWLVMAIAQVQYRDELYGNAETSLERCGQAVAVLNPKCDALSGTRARLAYLRGQVVRQVGRYAEARQLFSESVTWATRRFVANTSFAEIVAPVPRVPPLRHDHQQLFDDARLMANWTIGKAQALGLGWIDSTTGRLASADLHLNAGYAMLRTTGDWIYRAYSVLLMGVVCRARAGLDPEGLHSAIKQMTDAKKALGNHPYKLRACYELAQAFLRLKETNKARIEIDMLLKELPGRPASRQRRWECNGTVVKSRIERIAGNIDVAVQLAEYAEKLAESKGVSSAEKYGEPWIEARIAHGEALLERAKSERAKSLPKQAAQDIVESISCFESARENGGSNPKTVAVCHLHLARARCRLGRNREAKEEYAAWATHLSSLVEHGFVRCLANDVASEIRQEDTFFIPEDLSWTDGVSNTPTKPNAEYLEKLLHTFLARRAKVLGGTDAKAAEILGIDVRTVNRWVQEYRAPRKKKPQKPQGEQR